MANAKAFLIETAASLRRMAVRLKAIDGSVVEKDIAGRRLEADIGWYVAQRIDKIEAALKATGSNQRIDQWIKATCGRDMSTMRRWKRLHKNWRQYETKRRGLGQCGQTGLYFALSLVQESHLTGINGRISPVRSVTQTTSRAAKISRPKFQETKRDDRCQFITGDSRIELAKLPAKSVQCVVTSPPYWPCKRAYNGRGVGFEPTLAEYIANLVAIFVEVRRVLKDDGLVWVVMDDSYSQPDDTKSAARKGLPLQSTTDVRPPKNLMLIPTRFAMAMQDDNWILRSAIIWHKTNMRPEPVKDRPTKNYEQVLMFSKQRKYYYDPDPIRTPLISPSSIFAGKKPGVFRKDNNRTQRTYNNPMGGNAGSVWLAPPSSYRGSHSATMSERIVRQCLLASCPDPSDHGGSLVMDCFGGAGTVALAALLMGHRAISIDISEEYTREARQRIAEASERAAA